MVRHQQYERWVDVLRHRGRLRCMCTLCSPGDSSPRDLAAGTSCFADDEYHTHPPQQQQETVRSIRAVRRRLWLRNQLLHYPQKRILPVVRRWVVHVLCWSTYQRKSEDDGEELPSAPCVTNRSCRAQRASMPTVMYAAFSNESVVVVVVVQNNGWTGGQQLAVDCRRISQRRKGGVPGTACSQTVIVCGR